QLPKPRRSPPARPCAALPRYERTVVVVRVNGATTGLLEGDVYAVLCPALDCLMVPKVESAETLAEVDQLVTVLERDRGIGGRTDPPPADCRDGGRNRTVRGHRLRGAEARADLVFGLGDFSVDIGVD